MNFNDMKYCWDFWFFAISNGPNKSSYVRDETQTDYLEVYYWW